MGKRTARSALVASAIVATIAFAFACKKDDPNARPRPVTSASVAPSASVTPSTAVPPREERFTEQGMLAEAARYIDDSAFRRSALEASLVNPKNTYSRHRLEHYGVKGRGWDLLPVWNPQSVPVTREVVAGLREHRPLKLDDTTPQLWSGVRPKTMVEWIALGRDVFFGYPLRSEIYMRWALEHPDFGERINIRPGSDGVYPGARVFVNVDGETAIGITCAFCHTNVDRSGIVIVGEARRALDYGGLRLAYHDATKTPVAAELVRRMKTWGPGRADVTEDDDEDPVAIPDLWGLRDQTFLTQAGTIKHDGPTALAIRQETQLLDSNHQKIRPPRELAYALALFLYSLEPPEPVAKTSDASTHGRELFDQHCQSCHSNAVRGGPSIQVAKVGTNAALANGGARGTGKYRPPALVRVARAAPYFHDGSVPTLEDVLGPERLQVSYTRSPVGKGAVSGHTFGTDLPGRDREALIAFLRTL